MRKLGSFPRDCFKGPPWGEVPEKADSLVSFKGPHGPLTELPGSGRGNFRSSFFGRYSVFHFFTFSSQSSPRKDSKKCPKLQKSTKKHLPDLALNSSLQKGAPKCENRIPFNVLSLFPKVPGTLKSITN